MRMVERCHAYLKDWLAWNAVAAILLGLLIGQILKPKDSGYGRIVDVAILTCVFLMIFPMMVTVRLEAFRQAARNLKGVGLSIFFNFVWAPLIGLALASAFIDQSEVAFGFLVVMTVPCAPMSLSYTGLTKGDVELATIIVAVSFLLALVSVPFWLALFGGQFDVPVPYLVLGRALVVTLVLPMVFGYLTRRVLVKRCGHDGFTRIAPVFPAISMATMLCNIFLIFFSMASTLLEQWTLMLWLLVPNILFMAVTFLLVTLTTPVRRVQLSGEHGDRLHQHRQEQRDRGRHCPVDVFSHGRRAGRDHADLPDRLHDHVPATGPVAGAVFRRRPRRTRPFRHR